MFSPIPVPDVPSYIDPNVKVEEMMEALDENSERETKRLVDEYFGGDEKAAAKFFCRVI